jgi:hypothetical protein
MRKTFLTVIALFLTSICLGCSCIWGGNFIKSAKKSNGLVFKGKVIGSYYHFEDGTIINRLNQDIFSNKLFDDNKSFRLFIKVELDEIIKGEVETNLINIYAGDGVSCIRNVDGFNSGSIYLFSAYETWLSLEEKNSSHNMQYVLGSCSESSLLYLPESKEVKGYITGINNRKIKKMKYRKIVRKLK